MTTNTMTAHSCGSNSEPNYMLRLPLGSSELSLFCCTNTDTCGDTRTRIHTRTHTLKQVANVFTGMFFFVLFRTSELSFLTLYLVFTLSNLIRWTIYICLFLRMEPWLSFPLFFSLSLPLSLYLSLVSHDSPCVCKNVCVQCINDKYWFIRREMCWCCCCCCCSSYIVAFCLSTICA